MQVLYNYNNLYINLKKKKIKNNLFVILIKGLLALVLLGKAGTLVLFAMTVIALPLNKQSVNAFAFSTASTSANSI